MFEITFIDTSKTYHWSLAKCQETFGEAEFEEIRQGYLPHIVAVEI